MIRHVDEQLRLSPGAPVARPADAAGPAAYQAAS